MLKAKDKIPGYRVPPELERGPPLRMGMCLSPFERVLSPLGLPCRI